MLQASAIFRRKIEYFPNLPVIHRAGYIVNDHPGVRVIDVVVQSGALAMPAQAGRRRWSISHDFGAMSGIRAVGPSISRCRS